VSQRRLFSLRFKFILYLIVVHVCFGVACYLLLADNRIWLLAVEGFFVLSFACGLALVRALFEPIKLIRHGVEFIKAHDFGTRFREARQSELDPLIEVYNHMADNLRSERIRSQEQEHFLQRIISASPTGILALDLEDQITMTNPSAHQLLDADEQTLHGNRLEDLGTPFTQALANLEANRSEMLTLRGRRRVRCQALHFMDRGHARRFILMDELTEELHRSEKAAYEKLIRMLSHEVNNTTGAVSSLLNSCLGYQGQLTPEDRTDFADALGVAISRTGRMNRFMQEFADVIRLPAPRKQPCDLRGLLEEVVLLMKKQGSEHQIRWRWDTEDDLPIIDLDQAQMEQVFINLLKNAMEAIESDGTITLRLGVEADRPFTTIGDDGGGIPPEVQEQLFTPFFTSKENGQGIGLTLVQEILLGHGFDYSLESSVDGLTEFTIRY